MSAIDGVDACRFHGLRVAVSDDRIDVVVPWGDPARSKGLRAGPPHDRPGHARADLFEDMQERHDAMTAAGLTVLHNSPRRLRPHGREVIAQVERCYERLAGRGLPAGVTGAEVGRLTGL